MKLFQTVRKNLTIIGIAEDAQSFNKRLKLISVLGASALFSVYVHLFYVAKTPKEYMNSMFIAMVGSLHVISAISIALKKKTIYSFMNEVEIVIQSSKL